MAGRERLDRPAEGADRPELIPTRPGVSRGDQDLERMRAALMAEIDAMLDIPDRVEWGYDLDQRLPDGTTPRECLDRFDPRRANLPEVSGEQARRYIEEHRSSRPWLQPAADRCESVQRIFASLDQGLGHALERHEGFAAADKLRGRVARLEDPAQLDAVKRARGIDGCKPGDQPHKCSHLATAIQDPDAFATAFTRAVEDPRVRAVLDDQGGPGKTPPRVSLPIDDLLGLDGHSVCSGYRLRRVDGSLDTAMDRRGAWVELTAGSESTDATEPQSDRIKSFEEGTIEIIFRYTASGRYELATMYVEPPGIY